MKSLSILIVAGDPSGDLAAACEQQVEWYITKQPFTWDSGYTDGMLGVAVGFAAMMFLIGASAGGAEWSARTRRPSSDSNQ